MILDDVLVNFDSQRARAAAEVLCDFAAADRQLLVFTCHEHILQLFKLLDAKVTELPPSGQQPARSGRPQAHGGRAATEAEAAAGARASRFRAGIGRRRWIVQRCR